MAIVDLDKVAFYGAASQKQAVIERLQELGCLHLMNLGSVESPTAVREVSSDAHDALRFLRACSEKRRQVKRDELFDLDHVVSEAAEIKHGERELGDERDELCKAIHDLEPWGNFQLPADGQIGGMPFRFYVMPVREADKLLCGKGVRNQLCEEPEGRRRQLVPDPFSASDPFSAWQEVSRDHQSAYVVVLSENEPTDLPGQQVKLDPRSLSQLRARLEEVEEQLEELHHRRVGLTRWTELLSGALDRADDAAARNLADQQTLDATRVFAMQGWAPRGAVDRLRQFAEDNALAFTAEPPGPDDQPPTLLENPEDLAGGEGLVTFYKTPEYRAWDPSIVAYFSFAVFFAMILADAGYGAVIGLIVARYWKKMGQTRGGRRMRNVLATIVVCSIGYGVLCGSYFGWSPAPESLLGKLRIVDASSQAVMMPLTIVIGVIHLSLANLVMAWLDRGRAMALASLGWVAVMAGATVAGAGMFAGLEEPAADQLTRLGAGLLIGGLVAVFLFSSDRPILSLSPKNHLLRVFDGLKGLAGLSGLFGDVLSYLRLFALGLSSAKLAETFNGLAQGAWDHAGFGVILAIGILLLGHTLNLLLGIMSGAVHGLRLNCIEFFKWGLPEEGYLFSAFAKKGKEV